MDGSMLIPFGIGNDLSPSKRPLCGNPVASEPSGDTASAPIPWNTTSTTPMVLCRCRQVTGSNSPSLGFREYQKEKHAEFLETKTSMLTRDNTILKEENEDLCRLLRESQACCEFWKQDFAEVSHRNWSLELDLQKEREISDHLQCRIDTLIHNNNHNNNRNHNQGPTAERPKAPRHVTADATETVVPLRHDPFSAATEEIQLDFLSPGARGSCNRWSSDTRLIEHERSPVAVTDLILQVKEIQDELAESRKFKRVSCAADDNERSQKQPKLDASVTTHGFTCNIL